MTIETRAGEPVDDLELRLSAVEGISFEVVDAAGHTPLAVQVAVVDAAGELLTGARYATSGAGRVRMTTVPDGAWELLVVAGDSVTAHLPIIAPGPQGGVRLERGGSVRILRADLSHKTSVRLTATAGGGAHQTVTWAGTLRDRWQLWRGGVTVGNLAPGAWTVTAATEDGRSWTETVTVAAGETVEIVLE